MSDSETTVAQTRVEADVAAPVRKRPKAGQRREQILQTLAAMLEQPGLERITTAALAARLDVSEAALYRHFASKAQMFEGLMEFIEQSVFSLINQIVLRERLADSADVAVVTGLRQAAQMVTMVIGFAEKNPGLSRIMVGDALVFENERLQQRMNQFFDKVEASLKQCLRVSVQASGSPTPTVDTQVRASAVTAFVMGRLQRFARSNFKRSPSEHLDASLALLLST